MGTHEQQRASRSGRSKTNEAPYQERIAHFVLDDWMSVPAEHEPSRSSPTGFGVGILPEVTSCTEVGMEHLQPYADWIGPHDRVFAVRLNDGGVTGVALVAGFTRDDRLELLQAYCEWPSQGQKRELDARRQLVLTRGNEHSGHSVGLPVG